MTHTKEPPENAGRFSQDVLRVYESNDHLQREILDIHLPYQCFQ